MSRFWILAAFVAIPLTGAAQETVSGRVFDAGTGEILPYVTVAVKGKNIGVISDREGRFELWGGGDVLPTDSVVFSYVGYDPHIRTVAEITGGGHDIVLRPGARC